MNGDNDLHQLFESFERDHAIGEAAREHRRTQLREGTWAAKFSFTGLLNSIIGTGTGTYAAVVMRSGATHFGLIVEALADGAVIELQLANSIQGYVACREDAITQLVTPHRKFGDLGVLANEQSGPLRSLLSLLEGLISMERLVQIDLVGGVSLPGLEILSVGDDFVAVSHGGSTRPARTSVLRAAAIETVRYGS